MSTTFSGPVISTAGFEGAITGNVTGNLTGAVQLTPVVYSADGAISIASQLAVITKGTAAALTLAAPTATTHDGIIIEIVSSTAAAHTVTATTIGFNAADAAGDVGTFAAAIGNGLRVVAYQGEWYVLNNIGVTIA